jgi:hypothetical protein
MKAFEGLLKALERHVQKHYCAPKYEDRNVKEGVL